jgi:glycyl-tRNA synthetase
VSSVRVPDGQDFEVTPDLVTVSRKTFKESHREFTPNVIEPSFGIGRVLYSLLEHSYWAREEDVQRGVLSLPPLVAPIKCLIVPISNHETLRPIVKQICMFHARLDVFFKALATAAKLRSAGIASRVDDSSASIGKRYARNDELGTPFGVTVDFACKPRAVSNAHLTALAAASKGTVTIRCVGGEAFSSSDPSSF